MAGGRGGKFKVKRGGPKRFTPSRVLRGQEEEGEAWGEGRERPENDSDESGSEESGSEESESEEESALSVPANPKLGNTVVVKEDKPKKTNDDIENPNRATKKNLKASELTGEREMSRREREAMEKERARAAFWKAQEEGRTEQARADLARLAIIRKQREEAAKKRAEELAAKQKGTASKNESLNAGKGIISKSLGKK
ncbi:heat- and acid-stable phosphoprotein [Gaertneriomyces sp. JEL0708]|nr:casein kinase substrate phosphoprotein PP28-domain-containing protein [Gaertneriomyces semiglobifer]KAJ3188727.1 heat- and acid-stable phosphoprotein [Gaertneriomyces sp. JEL0708]